ncbi:hypothetical protein ABL78_6399 [Leptomonas seymouri]|uniref:Uncharacterized protein n=1 Tax=Leptomonas seymouri TaxID=5684 RepID=A0A0N0P485_LEPSE|nr:hypothetical protein ABL78_6399 [Leptomonas seymouri]|eukprot:KPI84537.1 hypothetical protein ABL78_6399 [Leptomonas seymouri]
MSTPPLPPSLDRADDSESTSSTFYQTASSREAHSHTHLDAARREPSKDSAEHASMDSGLVRQERGSTRKNHNSERPVRDTKRPTSIFVQHRASSVSYTHKALNMQQQQPKRESATNSHPNSGPIATPPNTATPTSSVPARPPSPPTAASSSSSDAPELTQGSRTTKSDSVTSSQYLYVIQRDLEALVQLQQQQLLDKLENDLQRQQQQQPKQAIAALNVESKMQLRSIDSVKRAFTQSTAHLRPPPPMPVVAAALQAADVASHGTGSSSLLRGHAAGGGDDVQATARSAHIAALPPPPPSSSPIPASLVEYHAYLTQLEHQQRQHYEVLQRQRKLQRKEEMERETAQRSAHTRSSPLNGEAGSAVAGSTPPRQRIGAASAGGAAGGSAEALAQRERRDRSPPLALMWRAMRHRGAAQMGGRSGGAAEGVTSHRWGGAYTDDDEEHEERDSLENQHAPPAPQQRSVLRRGSTTSDKGSRTTPRSAAIETAAKPLHVRSTSAGDGGDDGRRHSSVRLGTSPSPHLNHTSGQASLPSSTNRPRHATLQAHSDEKMRLRSSEAAKNSSTSRKHSCKAQRASLESAPLLLQQRQRLIAPQLYKAVEGALTNDVPAASLSVVSPIKPVSSLLEHELNELGLQNTDGFRLRAAASNPSGATPSSSPVEAFADALLLDTRGSPAGGHGGQPVAATAALLSVLPQRATPLPTRSTATAGAATTTTTMVGGTAAIHEPIAFSISPSGLVTPLNVDQHSGGNSRQANGNIASLAQQQQQQLKNMSANTNYSNARKTAAADYAAVASITTMSIPQSPDRDANGAETTAIGPAVAADATPLPTSATQHPSEGTQHCTEGDTDRDVLLSYHKGIGQHMLCGGQRERRGHHHHHNRRRSCEGISSMIPEHGTGTSRSSRYRTNSTGTGGGGGGGNRSRRQRRQQQAGLRDWSVKYDVEEEHDGANESGAAAAWAVGEEDWQPQPRSHRAPRHRNSGEHHVMITTDDGPVGPSKRVSEDAAGKGGGERVWQRQRSQTAGAALHSSQNASTDQHRAGSHNICGRASKRPWSSVKASISPASHRGKSLEQTTAERATSPPPTGAPSHPHAHHHPPSSSPSAAAVWHDVKRMWAPGPAPPGPFAPAYRYLPRSLTAYMPDSVATPSASSLLLLHQPPTPPGSPTPLRDPPANAHRQTTADSPNAAGAIGAAVKSGRPNGPAGDAVGSVDAPAAVAVAAAVLAAAHHPLPPASAAGGTTATSPTAPPSPPPPASRAQPARVRPPTSQQPSAALPVAAAPLFFMTDSLIGAALQDVLPVCRARQREVAREVDRRRYQLTPIAPSSTA